MDFYEALHFLRQGERVTKLEWAEPLCWGEFVQGQLCLHKPDGVYYPWIISEGDMSGSDWSLLD